MWKQLHNQFVFQKRIKVLSHELTALIGPDTQTILDIGSGNGALGKVMQDNMQGVTICGIDTLQREPSFIPVKIYDGQKIPFADNSFDTCMLVDVLHHLSHIKQLLTEAKRVATKYILIKDHQYKSRFDFNTLKFMDIVGNKPHEVALEYNYLREKEWEQVFHESGLEVIKRTTAIALYPFPFSLLFGRKLHFVTLLKVMK